MIGQGGAAEDGPRALAKAGLRRFGTASSALRGLPDFLIVGAKRAGTTSLWNSVVRHPNVLPMFPARMRIKGTAFFTTNHGRGLRWYRSHFPLRAHRAVRARIDGVRPIAGEATPYYLFHPLAPNRAARVVPEAVIVVILRDPVDRAYSHYRERVRHHAETLSFEDALDAEEERLRGEEDRIRRDDGYASFAHEHLSYEGQGRYAGMIERWLEVYPRERFLFLLNEDLDRDPSGQLRRLVEFLGLPAGPPPPLDRYNYHPGEPMDPSTRARLADAFADDNGRLGALLGMDLSAWGT